MRMVSEVMSRNVRTVSPQDTLQRTAQLMSELDVGALPVCEGERLLGMVTDRDITIRATAAGMTPQETRVQQVMTSDVSWVFEDQPLDEAMTQMADAQIRRVPVVSNDQQHRLVGIIALGDLVTKAQGGDTHGDVDEVVQMVSTPNDAQGGRGAMSMQSGGQSGQGSQGGGRQSGSKQSGGQQQSGSQQSGSQQSGSKQSGSQQSGSQQSGSQQSGSQGGAPGKSRTGGNMQSGGQGSRSGGGAQYGQGMDGELDPGAGGTLGRTGPDTESGI